MLGDQWPLSLPPSTLSGLLPKLSGASSPQAPLCVPPHPSMPLSSVLNSTRYLRGAEGDRGGRRVRQCKGCLGLARVCWHPSNHAG